MDFIFDLVLPLNTLEASPEEQVIDVGAGVIHQVEVEMPPGCRGMVYGAVRWGVHQVWPTNTDSAYRSSGRVYSTREHYIRRKGDPPLVIQGWSPETTYPHTIQFRFSVLPLEIMEPWRYQESVLDLLLRGLGLKPKKAR